MIKNGDLLLSDCGAELNGYASDITRTIPANGKFSKQQREIYEIVLKMQKFCLNHMKPGVYFIELYLNVLEIMATDLITLGILKGKLNEVLRNEIAEIFMPHGLGHFLGLDVHDPPFVDENIVLKEGMVITVEPGIYFIPNALEAAFANSKKRKYINIEKCKEYMGFGGIRIEDDVLIVKNGIENLTKVPKEIHEIEELMKKK